MINLAPFAHIPVTPIGQVPTATHPTDLARPPAAPRTTLAQQVFRYRDEPHRVQSIAIDRVVASPGRTSLEWTINSVRISPPSSSSQPCPRSAESCQTVSTCWTPMS